MDRLIITLPQRFKGHGSELVAIQLKEEDGLNTWKTFALTVIAVLFCVMSTSAAFAGEKEDLSKKSQNPLGNVISVPIEWFHYGDMANDSDADVVMIKPVYPVNLGSYNLINRMIIPYIGINANVGGVDLGETPSPATSEKESGLGNIQYQGMFSPADPGKIIWGLGPAIAMPTNSNDLGSDKWSAGPALVVLTMPGKWVLGALAQNIWSFAGPSDAADVNKLTFQYFINYNLSKGWYLTTTPVMTADWEKPSSERWTVPLGGGIGKMVRFGKQPVDFKLQAYSNIEKPEGGPDWTTMFAVKFLFPK
jgi:hypothetical protein